MMTEGVVGGVCADGLCRGMRVRRSCRFLDLSRMETGKALKDGLCGKEGFWIRCKCGSAGTYQHTP